MRAPYAARLRGYQSSSVILSPASRPVHCAFIYLKRRRCDLVGLFAVTQTAAWDFRRLLLHLHSLFVFLLDILSGNCSQCDPPPHRWWARGRLQFCQRDTMRACLALGTFFGFGEGRLDSGLMHQCVGCCLSPIQGRDPVEFFRTVEHMEVQTQS